MTNILQQIREATHKDKQYIRMLDIRCFDNVWSEDVWKKFEERKGKIWLGCNRLVPISMLALERNLCPHTEAWVMHIHKLCVSERFRKRGVGVRLLAYAHEKAIQAGVNWVTITVPEWLVNNTDDPRYCLGFLQRYKFKVITTLDKKVPMYGKNNDQYLFGFKIK